jgi:hypothetical protein
MGAIHEKSLPSMNSKVVMEGVGHFVNDGRKPGPRFSRDVLPYRVVEKGTLYQGGLYRGGGTSRE